jgi:polyhydroxyalkanoate synthase subunit PhaC
VTRNGQGAGGDDEAAAAAEAVGPEAGLIPLLDPVGFGESLASVGRGLARNPVDALQALTRYTTDLVAASAAAAARSLGADSEGQSERRPRDRRFADPAWDRNPLYYWLREGYLLFDRLTQDLVAAAHLEQPAAGKAAFASQTIVDALAPTNTLLGNPAAVKKAFETAGASVFRGLRTFLADVAENGGLPRQIDSTAFTVGKDLAATPGKVVLRNELMELIQYAPQTETVFEVPLLCSPPWINKYYVMDLAPGRSFIEWAVQHGHTVFAISYRNPGESMRGVTLDDYMLEGPRDALRAIEEITGAPQANIVGLCLGGTITTMLLAYLEQVGDRRVRSATLLNTLVDFSEPGVLGVFTDEATIAGLERKMESRGYLDASEMSRTFTLLRANDLLWNYVVNNWLLGEKPPPFDILAWNDDDTRLPAAMHSFYLRSCYVRNEFAQGKLELAGEKLNPQAIKADVYVLSAREDHIAPWHAGYATTRALPKGAVRFVLSSSGHIAGIVNPPGPKGSYWTNDRLELEPERWLEGATSHQGSWWEDWSPWIEDRAGARRPPPPMGSEKYSPIADAPGTYVFET